MYIILIYFIYIYKYFWGVHGQSISVQSDASIREHQTVGIRREENVHTYAIAGITEVLIYALMEYFTYTQCGYRTMTGKSQCPWKTPTPNIQRNKITTLHKLVIPRTQYLLSSVTNSKYQKIPTHHPQQRTHNTREITPTTHNNKLTIPEK